MASAGAPAFTATAGSAVALEGFASAAAVALDGFSEIEGDTVREGAWADAPSNECFSGMGVGAHACARLDNVPDAPPVPVALALRSMLLHLAVLPAPFARAGVTGAGVLIAGVLAAAAGGTGVAAAAAAERARFPALPLAAGVPAGAPARFVSSADRFFLFSYDARLSASSKCLRLDGPGGCFVIRGSQDHGASPASSFAMARLAARGSV